MIPDFDDNGLLPPGIHWATWNELYDKFGTTVHRKRLLVGLRTALQSLKQAGCRRVYINGSFVTAKEIPNDFDACWDIDGVDINLLRQIDPILLDFRDRRALQKTKYLGELFPNIQMNAPDGITWLEFFQIDRESGNRKGIIGINLEELL
ncbi:MAG: hypothetical protein HWN65_10660 [Candidatus Helarchaeota archaeon]|nr:hypothetical protein [Candidatus Helarchaeota archaeon]